MTKFIFENWPDTNDGLRKSMIRLVDNGRTYQEAIDLARQAYLRAMLFKMRNQTKKEIARRCGFNPSNLTHLTKKYNLM